MKTTPAIKLDSVSKVYKSYNSQLHRIAEAFGKKVPSDEKHVLRDISIEIHPGERVGILGENGSGKSTLLKVITGILHNNKGSVKTQGRITALLELGTGFSGEMTGYENIEQFGLMHGLSKEEIKTLVNQVEDFSELGDALSEPVRTYSSGMSVRLAFSCAVFSEPDIFIVDEALSVGDAYFQAKCIHKIRDLLDSHVTFLYVSHSMESVRSLCERALFLEKGKLIVEGKADMVARVYEQAILEKKTNARWEYKTTLDNKDKIKEPEKPRTVLQNELFSQFASRVSSSRVGDGDLKILDIYVCNLNGNPIEHVACQEQVTIVVNIQVNMSVIRDTAAICVGICDDKGTTLVHLNTIDGGLNLKEVVTEKNISVKFNWHCNLCPGKYSIIASTGSMYRDKINPMFLHNDAVYDYVAGAYSFTVPVNSAQKSFWGVVIPKYELAALNLMRISLPGTKSLMIKLGDSSSSSISKVLLEEHIYSPTSTKILINNVKQDTKILDMDNDIGWYSLISSGLVRNLNQIISVSIDEKSSQWVKDNFQKNSIENIKHYDDIDGFLKHEENSACYSFDLIRLGLAPTSIIFWENQINVITEFLSNSSISIISFHASFISYLIDNPKIFDAFRTLNKRFITFVSENHSSWNSQKIKQPIDENILRELKASINEKHSVCYFLVTLDDVDLLDLLKDS